MILEPEKINSVTVSIVFQSIRHEVMGPDAMIFVHSRVKKEPQKDCRRCKITFKIKPHIVQRHSEGSNKPCAHQDPEMPQRLSQNCV